MHELKFLSFQDISLFNLNLEKSLLNLNLDPFLEFLSHMWMHGPLQHFRGLIMTTTMMIFMVLDSRLSITMTSQGSAVPLAWYWES